MVSKKIKLAGIEQVQTFNQICSRCEYNVDLKQGKYLVDAKSIMGIYSLNIMGVYNVFQFLPFLFQDVKES